MEKFNSQKRLRKEKAEYIARELAAIVIQSNGVLIVTEPQEYHETVCAILKSKYHIMYEQLDRRITVLYLKSYSENKKEKIMIKARREVGEMTEEMWRQKEEDEKKALEARLKFINYDEEE